MCRSFFPKDFSDSSDDSFPNEMDEIDFENLDFDDPNQDDPLEEIVQQIRNDEDMSFFEAFEIFHRHQPLTSCIIGITSSLLAFIAFFTILHALVG